MSRLILTFDDIAAGALKKGRDSRLRGSVWLAVRLRSVAITERV